MVLVSQNGWDGVSLTMPGGLKLPKIKVEEIEEKKLPEKVRKMKPKEREAYFAKQIADLGEDVDQLMALAAQLKSDGNRDGARAAYRRVIEIDHSLEGF